MKHCTALLASALLAALPLAGATPVDPKSPIPGYPDGRGPKGPVKLRILTPSPDQVIPMPAAEPGAPAPKGARVEVRVSLENFETWKDEATGKGQHVQLVLNGRALADWHQTDKAWIFPALPRGTHTLLAFAQRPWQETIREAGAFAAVTFHVGERSGKPAFDPKQPSITVTAPRGRLAPADASKVLFDFFVTGCTLGPATDPQACQVVYRLNQNPQVVLTEWEPVFWEKVPVGKHGFIAALYRGEKKIDSPFSLAQGFFEIGGEKTSSAAPSSLGTGAPAGGAPDVRAVPAR